MSEVPSLKLSVSRRTLLFICFAVLLGIGIAVTIHSSDQNPVTHSSVPWNPVKASPMGSPAATDPKPAPQTIDQTAGAPTGKKVPSQAQPVANSSGASTYPYAKCTQVVASLYPKYNSDIGAENSKHKQILASLQQKYDYGGYYDPATGDLNAAYNDYLADVQGENERFSQATQAIQTSYNSQLSAAGCAQTYI